MITLRPYREGDAPSLARLARSRIVQTRYRRGDAEGAWRAIDEITDGESLEYRTIVGHLLGHPSLPIDQVRELDDEQGGVGAFAAGVGLHHAGQHEAARPLLEQFVAVSENNPTEWGVTLRWEIAKAKELLGSTSSDRIETP